MEEKTTSSSKKNRNEENGGKMTSSLLVETKKVSDPSVHLLLTPPAFVGHAASFGTLGAEKKNEDI